MQITQQILETEQEVVEGYSKGVKETFELTVDDLDDDSGFYQLVVRPMLNRGHEGELCEWLKEMGLLQRTMKCINMIDDKLCNSIMVWTPARIVDKYQWYCGQCKTKRTIRDKSCLKHLKCSFDVAIRIMLGWCKEMEIEVLTNILHCKPFIVKRVFELCWDIIDKYVQSHISDFKLGGNGTIVVVHVYPTDSNQSEHRYPNNNIGQPILCLAEVNLTARRTKFWFHPFTCSPFNTSNSFTACQEVVKVLQEFVRPGTSIVFDSHTITAAKTMLTGYLQYAVVLDTVELSKFDHPNGKTLAENLAEIWKPGLLVCERALMLPKTKVKSYLRQQAWRQSMNSTSSDVFEYLMHHIADASQEAT